MPAKTIDQNVPEVPTSAADWRKGREEGVLFHFPSGRLARVRTMNMNTFIRMNKIPEILTTIVESALKGELDFENATLEQMADLQDVYDIYCETCFIEPVVVMKEITDPNTQILAEDIADIDKQTLFNFLGAPASMLAEFRPYQTDDVDDLGSQPSDQTGS